jgi:phosphate/sulfate permease
MTRRSLPVSTSQAIVGAIVAWSLFTDNKTDYSVLTKILLSWVTVLSWDDLCRPVFLFVRWFLRKA